MNYEHMIRNTQAEFLGAVAARLVGRLSLAHRLAQTRFQQPCPSNWTYGSITREEGALHVSVWQQSDYVTAGNLRVEMRFYDSVNVVTVERTIDGERQPWLRSQRNISADHEDIAGHITNEWDKVLCAHFGAEPLAENRYPAG
jgi:hypothetical protein